VSATVDELRRALNSDPRTRVGQTLLEIDVLTRDDSGRATGLGVRGERSYTIKGDVLRTVINQKLGDRAVQSTKFAVARDGTRFLFEGSGFGHGVGLCQRGAMARIRRGDATGAILGTYYPGARLVQAGISRP
jgi:stage II sporulation protein D